MGVFGLEQLIRIVRSREMEGVKQVRELGQILNILGKEVEVG